MIFFLIITLLVFIIYAKRILFFNSFLDDVENINRIKNAIQENIKGEDKNKIKRSFYTSLITLTFILGGLLTIFFKEFLVYNIIIFGLSLTLYNIKYTTWSHPPKWSRFIQLLMTLFFSGYILLEIIETFN